MCLIVFSYKNHPDYPFILATNRDEFYGRPTQPAHVWNTSPKILAGKDEKAGGTWLGISQNGRFAALTNYRQMDDIREDTTSRGIIVKDFLLSDANPRKYLAELQKKREQFNGFNLIAGYFDDLYYISNKKEGVYKIKPGNHSVSNAFLNTPWPKTVQATNSFTKIVSDEKPDEEKLFHMLHNDERFPLDKLPDTGLPREMEKAVSSIFIETENYGTRSSTVIAVDKNRKVHFAERSYTSGSKETNKTVWFDFKLR
ncbi:NRDE family protein [Rhodohalobacter sp. 614A]|uniref:NRDE family protein n=1 Tax=Rhodohalobacter sp. 614A TaxID=2908649 RepID=UPI001F258135|nr:NRDE family protein [Rhodohalobacter sp. 614A]